MHHLMQEDLARVLLPDGFLRMSRVPVLDFFLKLIDLVHEVVGLEKRITHNDVIVVSKPAVVCLGVATDGFAIPFEATDVLLVVAAKDYIERFLCNKIGSSLEVIFEL